MKRLAAILLILFIAATVSAQITHNISTGMLNIPANSPNDYIITGSTTSNYVIVNPPYRGTITLRDVNIILSAGIYSPIAIRGINGTSNLTPISNVDIILEGNNFLVNTGGGRAAFQVDQGTQINISAINPYDNSSGTLAAIQNNSMGGAGIGSLDYNANRNEANATASLSGIGCLGTTGITAGGNVIISSGTITAKGGHGAGIGGGYGTYYDGMIVIYGGIVNASTIRHAA